MTEAFGGSVVDATMADTPASPEKKRKNPSNTSKRRGEEKGPEIMAKLAVKYAFGCTPFPQDGVQTFAALSGDRDVNDRIITRVGKQIVVYDPETGRQNFFIGRLRSTVNTLHFSISPNNRHVAVCESVRHERGDNGYAQCSVYNITTLARQKTVTQNSSGEFISCCFSGDSKYLATLLSTVNDSSIIVWQWEKEKVHKSMTISSKPTKISMPLSGAMMGSVTGPGVFKCWHVGNDSALKIASLLPPNKEGDTFLDHKWILQNDNHRLLVIAEAELPSTSEFGSSSSTLRNTKQTLYVYEGTESQYNVPPITLDLKQTVVLRTELFNAGVECIATYSKGFLLLGRGGLVSFFDKTEDKACPYFESRQLCLGEDVPIIAASVPPSEEKIIVVSKYGRLLWLPMMQQDVVANDDIQLEEKSTPSILATDICQGGFHDQPIIAIDIAYQRALSATISLDNTLRVWNYDTMKCEVVHDFRADEPMALAVHPSGFQLLVAFKEKLKLYNILMDKLKFYKETTAKNCRDVRFSHGGQYFAATSAINVLIFDTKTFSQLISLQGHMMNVKRLYWGPNDNILFSAGTDGNVYGWSVLHDHRIDVIASANRQSNITGVAIDGIDTTALGLQAEKRLGRTRTDWADNNGEVIIGTNAVAVALNDGSIRISEWSLYTGDRNSVKESEMFKLIVIAEPRISLTSIHISADRKFLYAGTNVGSIRCYDWPLRENAPYLEVQAHTAPVVDLRESPTGHVLISVGEDGSVFVVSVFKGQLAVATSDSSLDLFEVGVFDGSGNAVFNNQVLMVSKDDIDDHVNEVFELKKKIEETTTKFAFELHQKENQHSDEMKRMMEKHQVAINNEKEKFDAMQNRLDNRIRDLLNSIDIKAQEHVKMTAELENRYEHKLAEQLDRYDRLSEEMELLKQRCDGVLAAERLEFDRQLNEIKNEARQREKRMRLENKRIRDDRTADENAFKEILDQQETEYEDEVKQLISAAESELKSERDNITKLRTLVQTKNTKLDQMKKKLSELEIAAKARKALLEKEKKEKLQLQDTIEHYKKNLLEREQALAEKEKTILELRSTTRTLENFRFVLDHRLQQLSAERGPITQHIEGLEQHIRTMYEELVTEFEAKKDDTMRNEKKDLRLQSLSHEVTVLRHDNRQKDIYIATFRRELENVVGAFGQKELEAAIKQLYRKYVRGESSAKEIRNENASTSSMMELLLRDDDSSSVGGESKKRSNKREIISEIESELIESVKEAQKQKGFIEHTAENLKHRLENTKVEAARANRARLQENSHLIFECNELRKEIRNLQRKLESANNQLMNANRVIEDAEKSGRWVDTPVLRAPLTGMTNTQESATSAVSDTTAHIRKVAAQSIQDVMPSNMKYSESDTMLRKPKVDVSASSPALLISSSNGKYAPAAATITTPHKKTLKSKREDAVIEKLQHEVEQLSAQLDASEREKTMQRTELSRLRTLLAKMAVSIPPPAAPNSVQDDNKVVITLGNRQPVQVVRSTTTADLTGYPSEADLDKLRVGSADRVLERKGSADASTSSISSRASAKSIMSNRLPIGIDSRSKTFM